MIRIENLNKHFGKLEVLRDVNLNCEKGQSIALIGPNACGKTTLIKSILGMVIPSSGNVYFDGETISGKFAYRKHIGYMPQIGRYPENMTIGQVVDMIMEVRNCREGVDEELIEAFKLKQLFHKRMRTLSGGTTQKVSATLAFLFHPEVLILDEPTAGLDPLASEILKEKILNEKKKGRLILITSHLLNELEEMITQVIFMQEGRVHFHKNVEELKVDTGEDKLSKAISQILKKNGHE